MCFLQNSSTEQNYELLVGNNRFCRLQHHEDHDRELDLAVCETVFGVDPEVLRGLVRQRDKRVSPRGQLLGFVPSSESDCHSPGLQYLNILSFISLYFISLYFISFSCLDSPQGWFILQRISFDFIDMMAGVFC